MQFIFNDTKVAKRVAQRLKRSIPGIKLRKAQEIVARIFGYSNWHHMHQTYLTRRQDGNYFDHEHYIDGMATQRFVILAKRLSNETGIALDAATTLIVYLVPGYLIYENKMQNAQTGQSESVPDELYRNVIHQEDDYRWNT